MIAIIECGEYSAQETVFVEVPSRDVAIALETVSLAPGDWGDGIVVLGFASEVDVIRAKRKLSLEEFVRFHLPNWWQSREKCILRESERAGRADAERVQRAQAVLRNHGLKAGPDA